MLRSVILHDVSMDRIAAMERWYWRDHSPEIVRRYGPWSARHDSYLPVTAPAEALRFGLYNWRFTEGYWRELPRPGPAGALVFTPPPVWPRVAVCFTPWQPTEDFRGSELAGGERAILRWVLLHRYPADMAPEVADQWFVAVHVPELLRHPGAWRCFSYRTLPIGRGCLEPGPPPVGRRPGMRCWDGIGFRNCGSRRSRIGGNLWPARSGAAPRRHGRSTASFRILLPAGSWSARSCWSGRPTSS